MRYTTSNFTLKTIDSNSINISGDCCRTYDKTTDIAKVFYITNNGATEYLINGSGNPIIQLTSSNKYIFDIDAPGHPLMVLTSGTFDINSSGYENFAQRVDSGSVLFDVLNTSSGGEGYPLYYFCQNHPNSMSGIISIDGYVPAGSSGSSGATGSSGSSGSTGSSGSSSGGLWTPQNINTEYAAQGYYTKLWLDADDASTLVVSNNRVSSWTDKINNYQFTNDNSVLYPDYITNALNSKPIVGNINVQYSKLLSTTFDINNRINPSNIFYIFYVIKRLNNGDVLFDFTGNIGDAGVPSRIYNLNPNTAVFSGSDGGDSYDDSYSAGFTSTDDNGDIVMVSCQFGLYDVNAGARTESYFDTEFNANASSSKPSLVLYSLQNTDYLDKFYILDVSYPPNVQQPRVYGIAEVVMVMINEYEEIGTQEASYNHLVNSGLKAKIEGYLAHKWGTQSKLPSNHPYKNNPPS